MKLFFTKMHGCGNDYIYFNCFEQSFENNFDFEQSIGNIGELSIKLSNRNFSIGGDGIVLICPSEIADAKMRMFNLDGSEGKMCGNAIRCVGKFLYDNKIVESDIINIETLSGIKRLEMNIENGIAVSARVDMGRAELTPNLIPVDFEGDNVINRGVIIGGREYNITCVSMGNPHCVVFCDDVDGIEIGKIGPVFENYEKFPERINTEFIKVIDDKTLQMRVWERGSGETLACGTGACAAAVAACLNGYCKKGEDITVKLKGGDLIINYTDETVFMTGSAVKAFEGVVEI